MPWREGAAVGSELCMVLVELFLSHQHLPPSVSAQPPGSKEVAAALRGLLVHSAHAKATAVQLGLHSSLLASCAKIAAGAAAAASTGAGAARSAATTSKLMKLKQQRVAAAGALQPAAGGAGGGSMGRGSGRGKPQSSKSSSGQAVDGHAGGAAASAASGQAAEAQAAAPSPPTSSTISDQPAPTEVFGRQQQLLFLDILKHLAYNSEAARCEHAQAAWSPSVVPGVHEGVLGRRKACPQQPRVVAAVAMPWLLLGWHPRLLGRCGPQVAQLPRPC